MPQYNDGFVHPVPHSKLGAYKRLVVKVAEVWKKHGALDYWECVGDDLHFEGARSFTDLIGAGEKESILFGWVVFESREARDRANDKVAADPKMAELMAEADVGFAAERMAYGGFQPFITSSDESASSGRT